MNYFLSYAQNNEDVLLWRALGHIKNGFYIDVGANDPTEHSVTRAFYDQGWWGINIEPLPRFAAAFAEQRPRDINLAVAAGASEGEITLHDVRDISGWSTTTTDIAARIRTEGHSTEAVQVPLRSLAAVCAEHVRGDIHFLKIDVEGAEEAALRGMDFQRWRPWVLVIEATEPNSRSTNHEQWEQLVTSQAYHFVWFDGLNRYYVADEQRQLDAAFSVQPNVFDAYISWHLDRAWQAQRAAEAALARQDQQRAETDQAWQRERADWQQTRLAWDGERAEAQADRAALRSLQAELAGLAARAAAAEQQTVQLQEQAARLGAQLADKQRRLALARAEQGALQAQYSGLQQQLGAQAGQLLQVQAAADYYHQELATLYANAANLQAAHDARGARIAVLEAELAQTYASRSWRFSAPLRSLEAQLQRDWRAEARRLAQWLKTKNWARRLARPVLTHIPAASQAAQQLLSEPSAAPAAAVSSTAAAPDLSPLARAALNDLQKDS